MSTPLIVDNSTLAETARCETAAIIRYGWGYCTTEERAPLKAGTAGHAAMETWFRGGTRDEALLSFDESYKDWAQENVPLHYNGALDRLSWENTSAVLGAWLDRHPVSAFPFRIRGPEYVEIGFQYPLSDDVTICGRMDGLADSLEDHELYIVENKFPGQINETFAKQFVMGSQGSTYLWAAGEHMRQPVLGMYVNAVEFSKLPSDEKRKCTTHGVVFAECGPQHVKSDLLIVHRTPEQIESWKTNALALARKFQRLLRQFPDLSYVEYLPQSGWFNGLCGQCAFFDFCKTGRKNTQMLVYDRWDPLAAVEARVGTAHKP